MQPAGIGLALIFAERGLVVKLIDSTRTTLHKEEYDAFCTGLEMSGWRARYESRLTGEWRSMNLLFKKTIAAQEVDLDDN